MKYDRECPVCFATECFACQNGQCVILVSNDFGAKDCPFFKTTAQVEKEQAMYKKGKKL